MKINELKINSFGKIKNKEIKFEDGINVIYGKNEAGKSTLLNFIFNTFYGISKNKKGKVISDYEQYKPWLGDEFSGKIKYELDNNKKYEIYRDFNKKNPKIYNEQFEEISNEFNIDKKSGNEFFYEQTKIDEDLFLSTIGIMQKNIELEKNNQNFLVQKLANLVGTGEDTVSYKLAIDRINRRQLEEVGTERSKEKPLNIVKRNIEELENEKEEQEKYQSKKYEIAEEENSLITSIEELKNKEKALKEVKILIENQRLEEEKISYKDNIKNTNYEEIEKLNKELENIDKIEKEKKQQIILEKQKNQKTKHKFNKKMSIIFSIIVLINIAIIVFIENNLKYISLASIPLYLVVWKYLKNKLNNKIEDNTIEIEENPKIKEIENQIKLLEITNQKIDNEIEEAIHQLNSKSSIEFEKIKNTNPNVNIGNIAHYDLETINAKIYGIQSQLNNTNIELHKLKIDKENIEPQLDKLAEIEEKLAIYKSNKEELEKLNISIDIAKRVLEEAYTKMKECITPKFTQNLSKIIATITNNKYKNVKFNDENGIMVEPDTGDYVSIEKLSTGTIEQLYLSLRISMIDELSSEKLPLFLDETFAYYDDLRLKNILKFLQEEAKKRQIFIFTCTDREREILKNISCEFSYIEL